MKKTIMTILAVLSGITMTVTLIMINCFGIMALYNTMSCATLVFIMSGAYLTGFTDGEKEGYHKRDWEHTTDRI